MGSHGLTSTLPSHETQGLSYFTAEFIFSPVRHWSGREALSQISGPDLFQIFKMSPAGWASARDHPRGILAVPRACQISLKTPESLTSG